MVPVRSSYRAAQAVSPDKLDLTEKPLFDPPPGHVPIRVEASRNGAQDRGSMSSPESRVKPDAESELVRDGVGVANPLGSESKQGPDAAMQPPAEHLLTAVSMEDLKPAEARLLQDEQELLSVGHAIAGLNAA